MGHFSGLHPATRHLFVNTVVPFRISQRIVYIIQSVSRNAIQCNGKNSDGEWRSTIQQSYRIHGSLLAQNMQH